MDLWVFGYGSLVFRPAMDWVERSPAWIGGWTRRFWQASTDHRGVPGSPGRVATLVPDAAGRTWGIAYRVAASEADRILARLDHRERAGYAHHHVPLSIGPVGLVYVASEGNPNWLGPAPLADMALQIHGASGPSGANRAYLLRLDEALRDMGADDPHVSALADAVRALEARDGAS